MKFFNAFLPSRKNSASLPGSRARACWPAPLPAAPDSQPCVRRTLLSAAVAVDFAVVVAFDSPSFRTSGFVDSITGPATKIVKKQRQYQQERPRTRVSGPHLRAGQYHGGMFPDK